MDWMKVSTSSNYHIVCSFLLIGGLVDWIKVKTSSRCHIICLFIDWRISGLDERLNFLQLSFCLRFFFQLEDWWIG